MGKWINAEQQVTVTVYDSEHEERLNKSLTVEEMLDAYTHEGCPPLYLTPEQDTGEWIWDEDELYYRCSKCGKYAYETLYCMDGTYAYCPFCGKKMKGVIK